MFPVFQTVRWRTLQSFKRSTVNYGSDHPFKIRLELVQKDKATQGRCWTSLPDKAVVHCFWRTMTARNQCSCKLRVLGFGQCTAVQWMGMHSVILMHTYTYIYVCPRLSHWRHVTKSPAHFHMRALYIYSTPRNRRSSTCSPSSVDCDPVDWLCEKSYGSETKLTHSQRLTGK